MLRLLLWPRIWSLWVNILSAHWRSCTLPLSADAVGMSLGQWPIMSFTSTDNIVLVFCVFTDFCLLVLLVIEKTVLKYPPWWVFPVPLGHRSWPQVKRWALALLIIWFFTLEWSAFPGIVSVSSSVSKEKAMTVEFLRSFPAPEVFNCSFLLR